MFTLFVRSAGARAKTRFGSHDWQGRTDGGIKFLSGAKTTVVCLASGVDVYPPRGVVPHRRLELALESRGF